MFKHNYKYVLKILLRTKSMLFWLLVFPLALSTLFYMAFSNLEEEGVFKVVDVAIIEDKKIDNNLIYKEALKNLSSGKDKIFNIKYLDKEAALKKLDDKKVVAIIDMMNKDIHVKTNGYDQTIVKSVIDQIYEIEESFNVIVNTYMTQGVIPNPEFYSNIANDLTMQKDWLNDISVKKAHPIVLSYYTVLAMTASYGATLGLFVINIFNANKSKEGARMEIAPLHKFKLLASAYLASFTVLAAILIIAYSYLAYVLKVDFGDVAVLKILFLLFSGGLAGLSSGMMIGSAIRKNMDVQIGITISLTMFLSVLAGMMSFVIKRIVDKSLPIINRFNPVNLISDGFYALYYFDNLDRYYSNIINLFIISIVTMTIAYFYIRRQRYDSI